MALISVFMHILSSRSKDWVEYNYIVHNVKGSINIGEY
jgi:hypothetical protein